MQRRIAPSEFEIHIAVADALRWHKTSGWRFTHIASGELRDIRIAAKLKRMGVIPGWPDFMLFHCSGRVCALELKSQGKKPSPEQRKLLEFLEMAGHEIAVADSVDAALAILKRWGAL